MKLIGYTSLKNILGLPLKKNTFFEGQSFLKKMGSKFLLLDPRLSISLLLFSYLVLGITILGFNRSPLQILMTSVSACLLEMVLFYFFKQRKFVFPLSALITSFSLSLLLNYSHNYYLLLVPVFFAIGSKYLLTFKGRHLLNPAQAGVSFSLLFCGHLITSSPAYQWNGIGSMGVFIAGFGLFFLVPKVKRFPLVFSFLATFTLQTLFRAWLMKHHLPFSTLFFGTLTSPAFFLFTFFMITDPATSPKDTKGQVITGIALALLDLIFHIKQSYYTFFYAGLTLQLGKLAYLHIKAFKQDGSLTYKNKLKSYFPKLVVLGSLGLLGFGLYKMVISPRIEMKAISFQFHSIPSKTSGLGSEFGRVLKRVDPRIRHFSKWLLSVGDSVAVGDYNNDGLVDIFLTNMLKKGKYRSALYKNKGHFKFERVPLKTLGKRPFDIETYGLNSNAFFVDYDNDGDLDLFLNYAFGSPIMLQNRLSETGSPSFKDVTSSLGLVHYTNSLASNFFDFNRDGFIDLFLGQVWPKNLPDYPKENPQKLNLFKLPSKEYPEDKRMFNFMHASWHMADNGGKNKLFIQKKGRFEELHDVGIPETFWSLAIGTGDFNQDGWTDLYVANDFGPDNLYFNKQGKSLEKIEGTLFGSIGKDTYKGMNASVGDVDNNGLLDVYVSNVHHEMQAEGSLLWMFSKNEKNLWRPLIEDKATQLGALNEQRFGWGASMADFNNDGHLDITQANGMVDDKEDRRFKTCPDYWYVNEKIARSAPSIHRYAHQWGDIRGYCIYGNEKNRFYLNTGNTHGHRFVDVADKVGMTERLNSRGMAAADFNNDGQMDLLVTNIFSNPTLYKNGVVKANDWIGFKLESLNPTCNRQGVGSKVEIRYKDNKGEVRKQIREIQIATGFSAQSDSRAHFGLAERGQGQKVVATVTWCGLQKKNYNFLKLNQYQTLSFKKKEASRGRK